MAESRHFGFDEKTSDVVRLADRRPLQRFNGPGRIPERGEDDGSLIVYGGADAA